MSHTLHKEAFESAAAASFLLNALYLSVWLHLELLSPVDSVFCKNLQVMDKQFGEPLNHQYLDESVSLYHKQNRFSFSHSIFYTGNTVLDINNVCLCECLPCALWVFVFFFKWLCVSTLILTMLLCWLHVCFPQAAVRGQKGEKGEPAVLEPVSYWLSLSWFTWAGVFELALWQKEKAFPAKLLPEALQTTLQSHFSFSSFKPISHYCAASKIILIWLEQIRGHIYSWFPALSHIC